jgi:glycosyltransferase involved in cell wall biosynthesis
MNLLYLIPGEVGGVETYARELIAHLAQVEETLSFVVFISAKVEGFSVPTAPQVRCVRIPINVRNRYARYTWEQLVLPFQILWHRIDVLHSLNYVGPIICPCKTVVTIHDANRAVVGATMPRIKRIGLSVFSGLAAKTSDVVVTVSRFSKHELEKRLRIRPAKIRIIYSGCGADSLAAGRQDVASHTDTPYIMCFGGGYPHKNLPRLLRAYARACDGLPHRLVIVGHVDSSVETTQIADGPAGRIIRTGYVGRSEVLRLLAGARLFVLPSTYEGFGFPILEAQAAGVPVACSRVASIPEVAGAGAEYFDPFDETDMANTIRRVLLDRPLSERLVADGFANVRRFSWPRAAREYASLYKQVATA